MNLRFEKSVVKTFPYVLLLKGLLIYQLMLSIVIRIIDNLGLIVFSRVYFDIITGNVSIPRRTSRVVGGLRQLKFAEHLRVK